MLGGGAHVPGYRIERLVGRGGMGVVYLAEQVRLRRRVALKVIAPEYADAPGFRMRFERESQLAAAIDHPHVIPVYEAGESQGLLFISMRFVDGPDLSTLLREAGPFDADRALSVVGQIASALDAAHAHGLIHRDVKPANVLLDRVHAHEHAYLTDFGLTKRLGSAAQLTGSGQGLGTPDYCAPEQIQGADVDGRTDLYSLGCLTYACLTGTPPFSRETDLAVVWAHLNESPPRLSETRPDLSVELDAVVARGMAKSREARFGTCEEFVAELASAIRRAPSRARTAREHRPAPVALPAPTAPRVAAPPVRTDRRLPWTAISVAIAVLMLGATAAALIVAGAFENGGPAAAGGASSNGETDGPGGGAIDDATARDLLRRYTDAYKAHDRAAFAALFAPAISRAEGCGPVVRHGVDDVIAAYELQWSKQSAPSYRLSIRDIARTAAPSVTVHARYRISDPSTPTSRGAIDFQISDSHGGRALIDAIRVAPEVCP